MAFFVCSGACSSVVDSESHCSIQISQVHQSHVLLFCLPIGACCAWSGCMRNCTRNRTKMREMLSYNNPDPVLSEDMLSVPRILFLMGVVMLKATVAICHMIKMPLGQVVRSISDVFGSCYPYSNLMSLLDFVHPSFLS